MTQPIPREVARGVAMSPALTDFLNLNNPNSAFGKVFSGINISIAELETANATLQAAVDTNADGIADNAALISSNYTALADADSALATRALALETSVNHPTTGLATKAAISYVDSATSTLSGSIASTETTLRTEYQNADTALQGTLQADIDTRATIVQLNTVESNLNGSIATSETTLRAEFAAADTALETGLQTNIDAKASITYVDTADASLSGAISTSETTLRAEYQAADATLQTGIDNNAADIVTTQASVTTEATARADGDSANAALITALDAAYQAADSTLQTDINTRATINYVDTADASLSAAQATSETTLRSEYQASDTILKSDVAAALPNLLPARWQTFDADHHPGVGVARGFKAGTGTTNPYTGALAYKLIPNTNPDGSVYLYFGGDESGSPNIFDLMLPAGKKYLIGLDISISAGSNASVSVRPLVTNNTEFISGSGLTGSGTSEIDLTNATASLWNLRLVVDGLEAGVEHTAQIWFFGLSIIEKREGVTSAPVIPSNELTAARKLAGVEPGADVTSSSAAFTSEQSTRASEDAALASSITALDAAYQSADSALQGNIDTEEAARIAGDAALQTDVNTRATITYVDTADASLSGALSRPARRR